ncbi:MAG: NBR1-Ig-like domain-containing protein [Anaerolineales bacterium]
MNRRIFLPGILILWLVWLAGCAPETSPTPATVSIETMVAETVAAQQTLSAGNTAVAMLTQMASQPQEQSPSATPAPGGAVATPLPTPQASPTPQPSPCDQVELLGHPSAEPGAQFIPGADFVKTWRLKNSGSCTWDANYALMFLDGDPLGAEAVIPLGRQVLPGETLDAAVAMRAPAAPGIYQAAWALRSSSGAVFGTGTPALNPLPVRIVVEDPSWRNNYSYDFAAKVCLADWYSSAGPLACPSSGNAPQGGVEFVEPSALETRLENMPGILTRPNEALDGRIWGEYPAYRVQDGDRLRTEIGCLNGSQGCSVIFELGYRNASGALVSLGSWEETYDGRTTLVDRSLSDLSGSRVQFYFSLVNQGRPGSANGLWFQPRIENTTPVSGLILIWNQESGVLAECKELRIYLYEDGSGEARASTCAGGGTDLGFTQLSNREVNTLVDYVRALKPFEADVQEPYKGQRVVSSLVFMGQGALDATSADIDAINELAEKFYDRVTSE